MDIDNPSEAYFEAMRRLRPEPPDDETVERIVNIYRRWCRKQEQEELESEGTGGGAPPLRDPRGERNKSRYIEGSPSPLTATTST